MEELPVESNTQELVQAVRSEVYSEKRENMELFVHSKNHTILIELPLPEDDKEAPVPRSGNDRWDHLHVKLPSNPASKYTEISADGNSEEKPLWGLIVNTLTETQIRNTFQLEEAIKIYNSAFKEKWSFSALHKLFEYCYSREESDHFFENVLPSIIKLALRLPSLIQSPIPLLKKGMNHSISLSQEQAACILANAFLCTFPRRSMHRKNTDFPEINFNRLYSSSGKQVMGKLKCLLNYLERVCFVEMPKGVLTFQRRFLQDFPDWNESTVKISSIELKSSDMKIEDVPDALQIDFANRYLGGGVLGWGCVQEEIRFVINPEMIVGMLFCESMNSKEAIVMIGCERFNNYSGYSESFQLAGSFQDETPRDQFRRRLNRVVAIDALSFPKPHLQFEEFALIRELNKAYVGFFNESKDETQPILTLCTGNWGCGAFKGFKQLKFLLQLMACCVNRRNMIYCIFDEKYLEIEILEMFEFLSDQNASVGDLMKVLIAFRREKLTNRPNDLYSFIYRKMRMNRLEIEKTNNEHTESNGRPDDDFEIADSEPETNATASATPPAKRVKTESSSTNSQPESTEHSIDLPSERFSEIIEDETASKDLQEKISIANNSDANLEQPGTSEVNKAENNDSYSAIIDKPPRQSDKLKKITDFFKPKRKE